MVYHKINGIPGMVFPAVLVLAILPVKAAQIHGGAVSPIMGMGTDSCVGLDGSGRGARLEMQACTGSAAQNWKFLEDAAGHFQIVNSGTGMCLGVTGGSRVGTIIQQWACTGASDQKWNVSDVSGTFAITSRYSGLTFQTKNANNGSPVVQWGLVQGRIAQRWTMPAANTAANTTVASLPTNLPASGSPFSFIGGRANKCIGIANSSRASGALTQMQACNGSDFQSWKAQSDAAGNYQIINNGSGLCLDVSGGSEKEMVPMQQWGCSNMPWQKWSLHQNSAGAFYVKSIRSGLALDDAALSGAVVQSRYAGRATQLWSAKPAPASVANGAQVPALVAAPVAAGKGATESPAGNESASSNTRSKQTPKANTPPTYKYPAKFGDEVIGGAGGKVVVVSTAKGLKEALCDTYRGDNICNDTTPRIVMLEGVIDFNAESQAQLVKTAGCEYVDEESCTNAKVPRSDWQKLVRRLNDPHCDIGKHRNIEVTWNKLGELPLMVGSNKTLIGVGKNSGIKGRGLMISRNNNVIIRNISLTDINKEIVFAGDGITVQAADSVLIEHNYFARIGRQWITVGWDKATNVKIVNNEFDGKSLNANGMPLGPVCDGEHYFGLIVSAKEQTVTIAENWMHHFSGRTPDIRPPKDSGPGFVHLVNNLFEESHGHATNVTKPSRVLIEGNYYKDVDTPIRSNSAAAEGYKYVPLKGSKTATFSSCTKELKRYCVANEGERSGIPTATGGMSLGAAEAADVEVLDMLKNFSPALMVKPYPAADVPERVRAQAGPK